jgi:fructooligosaccharide transport system permease protein
MVLPGLANPFFIFLYRQFFLNIPKEIFESARIDGAGYLSIYFRIVFPIAKPVFTLTSISIFNGMWNAFLWPLMVITNPKYNLIQIAVQKFLGSRTLDTGYIMASLSISALPPLILFAFLQRYFVAAMRGIAK